MLEDLAMQYVNQDKDAIRVMGQGFAVAGGLLAWALHRGKLAMKRAPYFAYTSLFILLMALTQMVWLASQSAVAAGYLWILMIVDVATSVIFGYGLAVIAMARSRDVCGQAKMAFLAFIPLANLWLLFNKSREEASVNRTVTPNWLNGGNGILSGFVFLLLAFMFIFIVQMEIDSATKASQTDPANQQVPIDQMLTERGLEFTLREMSTSVQTPMPVDETTIVLRVEALGSTLRYTYEIMIPLDFLPDAMRTGLIEQNCTLSEIRPLIDSGATLEHVYFRPDRTEIGRVYVNAEACGS